METCLQMVGINDSNRDASTIKHSHKCLGMHGYITSSLRLAGQLYVNGYGMIVSLKNLLVVRRLVD